MMRQDFRLCGNHGWKFVYHRLRYLMMQLLPVATQQRLVSRFLNERMFEVIDGLRRHAALIQYLGLDQARQCLLQRYCVEGGNVVQHLIGKLTPQHSPGLGHTFGCPQAIQAGSETRRVG